MTGKSRLWATRGLCFAVAWLAVIAAARFLAAPPGGEMPPTNAGAGERVERRAERARSELRPFDAPDASRSYYREKRLGAGQAAEGFDSVSAYERARRAVARLPRVDSGGSRARVGAEPWQWLGPGNIGGRTRVLAIHPTKPKILYAGGVSGGIWKSTNRGKNWVPIGDQLTNLAVNSLAMDPNEPEILYAGTGEGYFREVVRGTSLPLRGGGIFKTSDGGSSWKLLARTARKPFYWVNDLAVSAVDGNRVYAATRKGVYRSLDAGRRWRKILKGSARGGCLDLALASEGAADVLFASCGTLDQAAVFRNDSAHSSKQWQSVLSEPGMGRTSLAIAPSDPAVVYALSASNVPGPGGDFEQALFAVFRSLDGGRRGSWEARLRNTGGRKIDRVVLSNPILAFLEECGFDGQNANLAMGWYVNTIAVDPRDPERVWVGGVDLFRSDDGGASFDPVTYWWSDPGTPNAVHADQHGIVFHPKDGKRLYALNDGGVYVLRNPRVSIPSDPLTVCTPGSNGGSWRSLSRNYGVTQFYHGTPTPDATRYIAGAQDNGTVLGDLQFGPNGWLRIFGGDGGYSAIDPVDNRILYVTFQNGQVRKSTNAGATFGAATNGISDLATNATDGFRAVGENFLFIAPLVMDPNRADRLWLGGRRLWRTDDGAQEWRAASAPLAAGSKISAIAIAPDRSDLVVVGTNDGWLRVSDRATLAGASQEWPGVRPRSGFVSSVAFDPRNVDVMYATYATFGGKHVWKSVDAGASWSAIDGSGSNALPDLPVHSLVVDLEDDARLFVGTDLGVLTSLDGGSSWGVGAEGLPPAVTEWISQVQTPSGERFLFAFTHGRGAWRLRLGEPE